MVQEAIGSVHYISPEQAKGSKIDYRTDLYSLGVMMYEMLTGKLPFEGETALQIVMQHINEVPIIPSAFVPGIPKGMDDIVMHADELRTSAAGTRPGGRAVRGPCARAPHGPGCTRSTMWQRSRTTLGARRRSSDAEVQRAARRHCGRVDLEAAIRRQPAQLRRCAPPQRHAGGSARTPHRSVRKKEQ